MNVLTSADATRYLIEVLDASCVFFDEHLSYGVLGEIELYFFVKRVAGAILLRRHS